MVLSGVVNYSTKKRGEGVLIRYYKQFEIKLVVLQNLPAGAGLFPHFFQQFGTSFTPISGTVKLR